MNSFSGESAPNLHSIPALRKIPITNSISLRTLEEKDAKRIIEIIDTDPQIRTHVTVAARLHQFNDVYDEIARLRKDPGLIRYTILENGEPIGLVSLWRDTGYVRTNANPNAYGYGYFLDPSVRGRGIAYSAVQKLIEVTSSNLDVDEFIAFCEDKNMASATILKKLGFKPTDETFLEPNYGWAERMYIRKPG